jgi:hypothetical protein
LLWLCISVMHVCCHCAPCCPASSHGVSVVSIPSLILHHVVVQRGPSGLHTAVAAVCLVRSVRQQAPVSEHGYSDRTTSSTAVVPTDYETRHRRSCAQLTPPPPSRRVCFPLTHTPRPHDVVNALGSLRLLSPRRLAGRVQPWRTDGRVEGHFDRGTVWQQSMAGDCTSARC